MMGLALTCCVPQILFEFFFARPFGVTAFDDSVDYEFASEEYAVDFGMRNCDAEWVQAGGTVIRGNRHAGPD